MENDNSKIVTIEEKTDSKIFFKLFRVKQILREYKNAS